MCLHFLCLFVIQGGAPPPPPPLYYSREYSVRIMKWYVSNIVYCKHSICYFF